ncbi:MAG: hypothetical protein KGS46_06315 [Chloroflexi bacterium]|jgi:hypothetical protein|nr:hypothetical protein [Chloroflexota bacterium]
MQSILADNNAVYLFVAYGVFLSGILIYLASLHIRSRALDRDEQMLDEDTP